MRGSSFARLSFLRPPLFVHSASPFYYFFSQTCHNVAKIFFGIASKFAQFVLMYILLYHQRVNTHISGTSINASGELVWLVVPAIKPNFLTLLRKTVTVSKNDAVLKFSPRFVSTLDVLYNR